MKCKARQESPLASVKNIRRPRKLMRKENRELAIIITILVLTCLSAILLCEAIERGWVAF
jgi:hypothetical protein